MTEPGASADNEAAAVRAEDALPVEAIDALLKAQIPGLTGTPQIGQFTGGASNLTFAVDYPGRRLILRCPPRRGKPASGHSMSREYRVISAIAPAFPRVPPALFYAPAEGSVIGDEFYVMARVDGPILRTSIPPDWGWTPDVVRGFCTRFWSLLADLHRLDYVGAGLGDFGRPEGYVARQISGWNQRYETALTPDADPFEDVRQWLADHQPADHPRPGLLHGDFRIDNVVLDPSDPTSIRALLDWELAAIGDPLMDLGSALAYWIEADDPPALRTLERQPSRADGMLRRREIIDLYAGLTDTKIGDFTFYYVYGLFRLVGIAQQIYRRFFEGKTTNPRFGMFGVGARMLGEHCRVLIREGMPT